MTKITTTFRPSEYKYDHFLVSRVEHGVRHVQFNNPQTLNAFAEKDWRDYAEIMTKLDKDPHTVVIIVSLTSPKAFSSGLNVKEAVQSMLHMTTILASQRQEYLRKHIAEFQECVGVPARMQTPTICLLSGINYGLALDISSCCTIRVATGDARFSIKEIKLGIPADIGLLQRLASTMSNTSLLFQHALRGDHFGARDALHLGYISKVVPDMKAGLLYCVGVAFDIAQNERWAVRGVKKSIQDRIDGERTVNQGLQDIAELNASNIDERFIEGMAKAAKL